MRLIRPDSRQPVGEQPLQPVGAAGAGHAVLGEVGALGEPDAFAHRGAFVGDDREGVGAAERHVLARLLPGPLEPQGMLEPEARAPYRVVGGEPVVDRRGVQWPASRELLVGEGDAEPAAVVLPHLGIGVGEARPVAEAGHVHRPDVFTRIAVDHPAREGEADPAALRETGHHRAGHPAVAHAGHRADQRIAVRREGERPVDHVLDPRLGHRRVVLERDLQRRGDPVEIGGQQLLVEGPRRLAR